MKNTRKITTLIMTAAVIATFFGTAIITTACNPDNLKEALETMDYETTVVTWTDPSTGEVIESATVKIPKINGTTGTTATITDPETGETKIVTVDPTTGETIVISDTTGTTTTGSTTGGTTNSTSHGTTVGTTVPTNGNPTSGTTSGTTTGTTSGTTTGTTTSNDPVTPTTEATTAATTEATTTTTTEATTVETTTEATTTTTTEATTVETTVETTAAYRTGVDVEIHFWYNDDNDITTDDVELIKVVHNVDPNVNWGASDTKAENALAAEYGYDKALITEVGYKTVVATYWSDGSVT